MKRHTLPEYHVNSQHMLKTTLSLTLSPKQMATSTSNILLPSPSRDHRSRPSSSLPISSSSISVLPIQSVSAHVRPFISHRINRTAVIRAAADGDHSSRRSSSSSEPRETILLPGCDFNHWLIVMEFPKDPAPTREQMIDTYLNTLATVLGSMEEAKKNMYAFSTTTYTGFQCTVSEETSEKFKGLPGVLWVLPDSYIDVKNKDYGGDKYINGEIIPCKYPTYQPKQRSSSKYESRRYERRRDGPPPERRKLRQEVSQSESASG